MSAAKQPNKYSLIYSSTRECIKQYVTYDGSNRVDSVYETMANAEDGDICLLTQYTYDGTSNRVVKMKESESVWSSSYDI